MCSHLVRVRVGVRVGVRLGLGVRVGARARARVREVPAVSMMPNQMTSTMFHGSRKWLLSLPVTFFVRPSLYANCTRVRVRVLGC